LPATLRYPRRKLVAKALITGKSAVGLHA
jgi:hypothetical protein